MIWFFSRDDEGLRIETRFDNEAEDYVVVAHWPDGRSQTERFRLESEFRSRVRDLQRDIEDDGWASTGSPQFLLEGWPRRVRRN
jgi:hypothetical protein